MDTGKLDFCCPECDSNEWYTIDDVAKLYSCTFCYHVTTYYHDKQKREQEQLLALTKQAWEWEQEQEQEQR